MNNYFCVCGQMALALDCTLDHLPVRQLDGARVLEEKWHRFFITSRRGRIMRLKREKYVETQQILTCIQCETNLFYKHHESNSILFVVKDALVVKSERKTLTRRAVTRMKQNMATNGTGIN